ncbi:MAG: three-Cys-motif partner protein TcmP [Candidatus Hydrogenedens sp.]|nr:three-Cys-motif partner protein TcmP [Candidatus Hydrogenedens sp.]
MTEHRFGGDWTRDKLDRFGNYLAPFTTALKNTGFELIYMDAFAGSGEITLASDAAEQDIELFQDEVSAGDDLTEGSVVRALRTDPPFARYYFIEKDRHRASALQRIVQSYPHLSTTILIEDANVAIPRLCEEINWRTSRAVLFLDPYGMQMNWSTIEAVAKTGKIDTWLLLPYASAINRMLRRDGKLPESWEAKLNTFFGTDEWKNRCYRSSPQFELDFVDESPEVQKMWNLEDILSFCIVRLDSVFEYVYPEPKVLRTKDGHELFALCFACGNKAGARVAKKIVDHIMRMG